MMTYQEAEKLFNRARDKSKGYRLPGRQGNTRLVKVHEEAYGIKLYSTIVVLIYSNGTYQVNTGGWNTPTTFERIKRYSPARLSSYLGYILIYSNGINYHYANGWYKFNADGTVLNAVLQANLQEIEKEYRKRRYALQKERREKEANKKLVESFLELAKQTGS